MVKAIRHPARIEQDVPSRDEGRLYDEVVQIQTGIHEVDDNF
ncbi:hypothetical protein [Halomicrococcus gelatinilyticus]